MLLLKVGRHTPILLGYDAGTAALARRGDPEYLIRSGWEGTVSLLSDNPSLDSVYYAFTQFCQAWQALPRRNAASGVANVARSGLNQQTGDVVVSMEPSI